MNAAPNDSREESVSAARARQKHDQEDFEARLDEHRGIVFKLANAYCRAREERDDLVQEICLQLWRAFPRYDPERRFSTWMYRVALNTAISFARTRQARERRSVPLDESLVPATSEPVRASVERVGQLYRVMDGLGELERALLLLYLEEHSYRDIAEVLGISETNVGTKLNRLKLKIRRELAPQEEAQDGTR